MSKAPAFQLYAADFYMDTVGWPNEAIGAYFRLLMAEWVNGPLPSDHYQLSRICQTSVKKFDHFSNYLLPKFVQKGEGFLINERLEKTRDIQQQFIEKQREKGKKRAKERWAGHIAAAIPRLQPEGKPENASSSSSLKNKTLCVYAEDFEAFWKAYPKRSGSKKAAFDNWKKLNGQRPELAVILTAITAQIKWRENANGEFRPEWKDPERWIKGRMWEAETGPAGMGGHRPKPTRLPTEQEELAELEMLRPRV